jgi:hypothetical protein
MPDALDALLNSVRQPNIDDVAKEFGVRPELVRAVMQRESAGNPNAVSSKGAIGLMQLMPATAAQYGADPTDPGQNMHAGVQHLRHLLDKYKGDERLALAAYNAGEGRVDKAGGVPNIPETQQYVDKVSAAAGAASPSTDSLDSLLDSIRGGKTQAPPAQGPSFLDNAVTSAKNFGGNVLQAVVHPLDTADSLAKLGAGVAQKYLPRSITSPWMKPDEPVPDYTAYPDALGTHYKNRYGSVDAIKNTLYTDPVGAAADAATVLTPAGRLMAGAGELSNLSRVAQIGRGIETVGNAVDPLQAVSKVTARVVQPLLNATAEHLANVNLQVPKNMRRREMRQGGVPHAEAVLNTGRGTNPFTRFSEGGRDNAVAIGQKQMGLKQTLRDADEAAGNTYDPSPIDKAMEAQAPYWSNDPTESAANMRIIGDKRGNFINNPKFSQDDVRMVPVQQTVQVPTGATNNAGQPVMQSQTVTVMQPQVVGRKFRNVGANQLEAAKGPVYNRQAANYGPGRDAVGDAVDKAAASAADNILDTNIPGYDRANKVHQQAEVARKALDEAILARQTKRKGLFAESMAFAAPIIAAEGHLGAGLAMGGIAAYNTIAKHPWLASPTAAALWGAGHLPTSVGSSVTPITQASQAVKDVGKRNVTKDEAQALYEAYLASHQK